MHTTSTTLTPEHLHKIDAYCLLSVWDHCLRSRHYVNVVIAGKYQAPQWLTMDAAIKHCTEGIGIWQ